MSPIFQNSFGFMASKIPPGLIIPYNSGDAVPDGWIVYSDADDYYLFGAGIAKNPGDTFDDSATELNTTTNGAHTGNNINFSTGNATAGGNSAGDHTHTFNFGPYAPPFQQSRLIKASSGLNKIPVNGVVFGQSALAGLDNIWDDDFLFKAGSSLDTGGTDTPAVTTSAEPNHSHGSSHGGGSAGKTVGKISQASGGHTHTSITVTVTNDLNKVALSAWEHASLKHSLSTGMIAMFEGAAAPAGWSLCDGNGGRPDLRDHYVKLVTTGSEGDEGDGTITLTASFTHATHRHWTTDDSSAVSSNARHSTYVAMAAHTVDTPSPAWEIQNFALVFIMKD